MSGTHDRHMEEDRDTLAELDEIWHDLGGPGMRPDAMTQECRQRLGAVHRRLKEQFSERYGEEA
jgi:hypothetical protein